MSELPYCELNRLGLKLTTLESNAYTEAAFERFPSNLNSVPSHAGTRPAFCPRVNQPTMLGETP